jgi:hypothetical protein
LILIGRFRWVQDLELSGLDPIGKSSFWRK